MFWSWSKRRPQTDRRVVLYTRTNCPLCDDAKDFLTREQQQFGFVFEIVDITSNPALICEFGNWIPVVAIDGQVRFRGKINPVLWRRILE
jgi:glutaredoxin